MELDLNKVGNNNVQGTNTTKKMSLSENVSGIIFQMFTSNIYSNPIGTVVREITSNCFDSHVEADVNKPVVIRLTKDNVTNTRYVSFIDFGVGMSPERVENIYAVYFESTKRTNNNEIGGFGIGGKTPLAYKRYIKTGEGEYDNSFFVITRYNGTEYVYTIFEGKKSPEYMLLDSYPTKEHNGTEIKIPILEQDIYKFETEIIKQLYYFENIVFEGFSDRISNDYKIIKGQNFLYRGKAVSDFIHVCLGRVAYPIDYSVLNLNKYDYQIPVAINVPIGKINVVASREHLDYSDETIQYLKKKLDEVVTEIKELLYKQNDNVQTLFDFYVAKQDILKLKLIEGSNDYIDMKNIIDLKDVKFNNFKYKDLKIPAFKDLFYLLFNKKRYGIVEKKKYYNEKHEVFHGSFENLTNLNNVYYLEDKNVRIGRKLKSYLLSEHGRIYLITKKDIEDIIDNFDLKFILKLNENDTSDKIIEDLINDMWEIVTTFIKDITKVEIPEDFQLRKKINNNNQIVIKFANRYLKDKVYIKDLVNFNGVIFYDEIDNEFIIEKASNIFERLFSNKHIANNYYSYKENKFGDKNNIMFITMSKTNLRYMKFCKNAHRISDANDKYFYFKFLRRKEDKLKEIFRVQSIFDKKDELEDVFSNKALKEINERVYNIMSDINKYVENNKRLYSKYNIDSGIKYNISALKEFGIDVEDFTYSKYEETILKKIEKINKLNLKNKPILEYIRIPSWNDYDDTLIKILKKVMVFK